MWVDTHCHLDFLAHPDFAWQQAQAAGVTGLVLPAVSPDRFDAVRELAHRLPGVGYCLGIHPCAAEWLSDESLRALDTALASHRDDPRLVGVGEIGLDYFVKGLPQEAMMQTFHAQLRLARQYDLPVVLHVRRSQDQVLAGLRRFGLRQGIAHAFNGSQQQADAYVRQGLQLGFGGVMTYTRSLQIRRLAGSLPLEAIVLETDSPDLAPAWMPTGAENSPLQIPQIADCLAQLRGLEGTAELAIRLQQNAVAALPRLATLLPA